MAVFKDKPTGKWKSSSRGTTLYETKEECQRAQMDDLANRLATVRKKLSETIAGYGK
jgi:hypothetical protein